MSLTFEPEQIDIADSGEIATDMGVVKLGHTVPSGEKRVESTSSSGCAKRTSGRSSTIVGITSGRHAEGDRARFHSRPKRWPHAKADSVIQTCRPPAPRLVRPRFSREGRR